jgi:tryptophan 2,3-dioxygenase
MAFGLRPTPGEARLTYGNYLKIDELLSLQRLLSDPPQHDELLFITIHQVYELWFKQLLHELDSVVVCLDADDVLGGHRLLRRCIEIQRVLIEQITVLETMTPNDFLTFRDELMPASGFQSAQFRALEFVCGLEDAAQLEHYAPGSPARMHLERRLEARTIGDAFRALIDRRAPSAGDSADPAPDTAPPLIRRLLGIYQNPGAHYDLYLLAEALIEFDEMFYLWRLRHVAMVERMIGAKPGTGGSDGVAYLRTTLGRKFFPELWELRSWLSPRSRG